MSLEATWISNQSIILVPFEEKISTLSKSKSTLKIWFNKQRNNWKTWGSFERETWWVLWEQKASMMNLIPQTLDFKLLLMFSNKAKDSIHYYNYFQHFIWRFRILQFAVPGAGRHQYAVLILIWSSYPKRIPDVDRLLVIGPLSSFAPGKWICGMLLEKVSSQRLSGDNYLQKEKKNTFIRKSAELTLIFHGGPKNTKEIIDF